MKSSESLNNIDSHFIDLCLKIPPKLNIENQSKRITNRMQFKRHIFRKQRTALYIKIKHKIINNQGC